MSSNKNRIVVLGIGNSIRRDDGAGIKTVEALEEDTSLTQLNIDFKYFVRAL